MEISSSVSGKDKYQFPLSYYFKIADQLIYQAKICRDEGNTKDLVTILDRYCRLLAAIPHHSSYWAYSAKDKRHHNNVHHELANKLEVLKTLLSHDSRTRNSQAPVSYNERESVRLMEDFLELAKDNTNNDLETCGVLGAYLKNGVFYVTTLIIPKQEATSSSCQASNEEEIYAVQHENSLFPLGWIHTHPSQTCFMSSIDLHTQFCYQIMLPEAVAIVMAPTDPTRSYGIFRLSDPGGTGVLRDCQERGFHPHPNPSDGSPIYQDCSNVYFNPNLRFEIFDLR
ncbi:ubiquitinyl hydrolase 1 [Ranunculus cassubicifolius]